MKANDEFEAETQQKHRWKEKDGRKVEKTEENGITITKAKAIYFHYTRLHPKISRYQGCSLHPTHGAGGSAL